MIVFKTDGENPRKYSHVECDVPGCGAMSPVAAELLVKNLFERGWYCKDGTHRCPDHYGTDTTPSGPVVRRSDGTQGKVR